MLFKEICLLIVKDFQLELKHKYALNGILLYVVSTVFVAYLSFKGVINSETWNSLFWIIFLFSSINAVSKSFILENSSRQLYYYSTTSPVAVIFSKIIYNCALTSVLAVLTYGAFALWMGDFAENHTLFLINLILGSFGFASILTMVAGIAWRAQNNFTLIAVLSFPLVIPLLISLIKVSENAIGGGNLLDSVNILLMVLLLNLVVLILSYLLFPYLWKD